MAFPLVRHESRRISWGIYKPIQACNIDDAIAHITKLFAPLERAGSVKAAILRSINGSLAAVFAVWNGRSSADQSARENPAAAEFTMEIARVVRVVKSGWMQMSSHEHTDTSFAKLCVGDIVSLRRIYSSRGKQDVLAYSCLAILKAYFAHTEGILSATFYECMDGKRIIGLAVWDGIESASALLGKSKGSPGEAYWSSLKAKKLKYDVCQVVHVTEDIYQTGLWYQTSELQIRYYVRQSTKKRRHQISNENLFQ